MPPKLTIAEYLSGEHDEELRVLVAEARGQKTRIAAGGELWSEGTVPWKGKCFCKEKDGVLIEEYFGPTPFYSTSLDACRELLADLTESEWLKFVDCLSGLIKDTRSFYAMAKQMLNATPTQICIAYLLTKGVLSE